ncbi:MAG: DUF6165 family protein [Gammaproteobacteria bacterium]|nr:DUF6165 family protein [Gammaproteobacteria bacterium]
MSQIHVPISIGELIDKITVLEIKMERIGDASKRKNVRKELELLNETLNSSQDVRYDISKERAELKSINEALWDIEDQIRLKEAEGQFDEAFVELARAVYVNNDKRAAIKRQINILLRSDIIEEKSYADYTRNSL